MEQNRFGKILPITLMSYFLIIMDNSVIFTSSVQIGMSFHLSQTSLGWISTAYTLTFGGFLLLSGRLSDLVGKKYMFQWGLLIFTISSFIIGVSPSPAIMIGARAFQGIGSSIIAPTSLAIIVGNYKGDMRTRAISYYGAMAGIGSSVGLLIGGALTSYISWRAGFMINIPIGILLIIFTHKYIKDDEGIKQRIDYIGSILYIIGISVLIYGLNSSTYFYIYVSIGIVFLIVFCVYEKKIDYPIIPMELFRNKVRMGGYITRLLFMMSMLPYWFVLPQVIQNNYGVSALGAGMSFLPLTIVTFLVALRLSSLIRRFSISKVLVVGDLALFLGLIITSFLDLKYGYFVSIAIPMLIIGVGQALVLAPVTQAGMYKVSDDLSGVASGITNTMHQIGGPIGLSIILSLNIDYYQSVRMMALFSFIAIVIVYFMIYRFDKNNIV